MATPCSGEMAIPCAAVEAIAEQLGYPITTHLESLIEVAANHLLETVGPHVKEIDWSCPFHRAAVAKVLGQSILERCQKPKIPLVVRAGLLQEAV